MSVPEYRIFVLSFFPRDVLDGVCDLIGSVAEGFPACSYLVSTFRILGSNFSRN